MSDLIPSDQWDDLYDQMPARCQVLVDDLKKNPDCIKALVTAVGRIQNSIGVVERHSTSIDPSARADS